MVTINTDILIAGGGPAGMAAALGAGDASDARILVVDDNPDLGGQIWRAELGRIKSGAARELIGRLESGRFEIISATVFGRIGGNCVLAESSNGKLIIKYRKLVIATGSRERFLPFPGWTLPGVFGAGGLQALVKGGFSVAGKRIIVAGTGALLLAVAEYLKSKGADVPLIVEQTQATALRKFGLSLVREPKKIREAIRMRAKLIGTSYLTGAYVTSVIGSKRCQAVNIRRNGKDRRVECDYLASGFHLVPNLQLALLLGCECDGGRVNVDELQLTSIPGIYCAGEPTGIGGVELSLVEGKIAGLAAVGRIEEARSLFPLRDRAQRFADKLNATFELRPELRNLPGDDTIVCRCEDVIFGKLKSFDSWKSAKMQARCGMGPCQGQVCGPATRFLFDWKTDAVRPPIVPVLLSSFVDDFDF